MSTRLLWINPAGIDSFNQPIEEYIESDKNSRIEVDVVSMPRGPHHLEYQYYCALAVPDILHRIKQAEKQGYDGAIIGGFYDLALREAREITTDFVVTAPAESCMHIATTLGDSFSIIVGRKRWIAVMEENVVKYGFRSRLASFKAIGIGVLDFQVDREKTLRKLLTAARQALEKDLADTIILGCTIEFGFFRELQKELRVPVIDPVLAPLKYAEFLIELKDRFRWTHSKALRYQTPSAKEIRDWDLANQYSFEKNLWESE